MIEQVAAHNRTITVYMHPSKTHSSLHTWTAINCNTTYQEVSKHLVLGPLTMHDVVPFTKHLRWRVPLYITSCTPPPPLTTIPFQNPMMKTSIEAFVFLTSCVKIGIEILAYALNSKPKARFPLLNRARESIVPPEAQGRKVFHSMLLLFRQWKQRSEAHCSLYVKGRSTQNSG
jgi:hypothetical protein